MAESTDPLAAPSLSITQCVTLKLSSTNYLLWKIQFESFLSSQSLLGFVDGTTPCPLPTVSVQQGEAVVEQANPEFVTWIRRDQLVIAWLFGSLTEDALRSVYGLRSANEVWLSLAKKYNRVSSTRKLDLQRKLQGMAKNNKSMSEYLSEVKSVCDQLDSIGCPVSEQEKIYGALSGLGKEYESISTVIEHSMESLPDLTYEDAVFKLVNFDDKQQVYNQAAEASPHLAFNTGRGYSNRGRGYYSNRGSRGRGAGGSYSTRGRGFHQQFAGSNSSSRPTCQICNRFGHSAARCYNRFDQNFQPQAQDPPHNALTTVKLSDQAVYSGQEWYPDSATTAHIINDGSQLKSSDPYLGNDQVIVGNGDFLPITHVGSIPLHTPKGILPLNDVLVCPGITRSLLSVSKLTSDYLCEITFDDASVLIKDKVTKQVITKGTRSKDLYLLKDVRFQAFYSSRQRATCEGIWHQRLGHPHMDILKLLSKTKAISFNKSSQKTVCDACPVGKSCNLPFLSSESVSTGPLEKIHSDLWGPSPVMSTQGFRYYVIFIDDFTKFAWFYPLKLKSDFFSVFTRFQQLVENQFQCKIRQFQCDGGGEFVNTPFLSHLSKCGIKQLISCPHTPQQNGLSERKHRHLTELGLTMLYHGRVPQQLWVEAFFTANYLINLLPSSALPSHKSPYEMLFHSVPNYTSLRVFGSKCFPTLRPYMHNKLDPKSLPCVFLGYNEKYKGYRCLYPPTGTVFISRHVIFVEDSFPYADIYINFHKASDSSLLNAWRAAHVKSLQSSPAATPAEELVARRTGPPPQVAPAPIVVAPEPAVPEVQSDDDSVDDTQSDDNDDQNNDVQVPHVHPMTTRARAGIVKPNPRYAFINVKEDLAEPRSVKAALKHPGWNGAMGLEIHNMEETETFDLVPPEEGQNPLGSQWIYKTKYNADDTVLKPRARLVAKGNEQEEGLDFVETFSPVVRTATIRTVLHVAVTKKWSLKQLDVQNAFLHGDLKETVFLKQPPGFVDPNKPDYVWKLKKAIYGLRQAPRAWFDKFSNFLLEYGFQCSFPDPSLFVYHHGSDVIYLLLYVDDMIITGSNNALLDNLIAQLSKVFRMKDMGPVHYFLGIQVHHVDDGLFLNQEKYATDLLINAGMKDCSPMSTPLPLKLANVPGQDELFSDPSYFRSIAGKLQYLTLTRPDLQFSVNYICQRMHSPTVSDFTLLKRILRYVKGTLSMGIGISAKADSTLVCYSDSDWAGCSEIRRSTGGFCTMLGSNVISWSAKRHETVSKSSTEAEYRTMSLAASEIVWLQNLLRVMGLQQQRMPLLLCDNLSAVCLTANPMFHKRTKHFDVDYHYVRERVALKALEVKHIPASLQLADVFTKSLSQDSFYRLRGKLGVVTPPTPSLRGCISQAEPKSSSQPKPTDNTREAQLQLKTKTAQLVLSEAINGRKAEPNRTTATGPYTAHHLTTKNRFNVLQPRVEAH